MLSLFLLFFWGQTSLLEKKILSLLPQVQTGAYFYSLIPSNENHKWIVRKVSNLPGVSKVKIISKDKVRGQIDKVLEDLNVGSVQSELTLNYTGIEVLFTEDLSQRSQELIRSYLRKLVGENKIILGTVRYDEHFSNKKKFFISIIKRWGVGLILGLLCLFWFLSFISFSRTIKKTAYIIEQFQRRTHVSLKLALTSLAISILFSCLASSSLGNVAWRNILAISFFCLSTMLFYLRKISWMN
jgi:cell division protein FtsX